jgi:hypothetical protein
MEAIVAVSCPPSKKTDVQDTSNILSVVVDVMLKSPQSFQGKHKELRMLSALGKRPTRANAKPIDFATFAFIRLAGEAPANRAFQLLWAHPNVRDQTTEDIAKCAPGLSDTWEDRVALQDVDPASYFSVLSYITDRPHTLVTMRTRVIIRVIGSDKSTALIYTLYGLLNHYQGVHQASGTHSEEESRLHAMNALKLELQVLDATLKEHDTMTDNDVSTRILQRFGLDPSPLGYPCTDTVMNLYWGGKVLAHHLLSRLRHDQITEEDVYVRFEGINFVLLMEARVELHKVSDGDLFRKIHPAEVIVAEDWNGMVHDDMDGVNLLEHVLNFVDIYRNRSCSMYDGNDVILMRRQL